MIGTGDPSPEEDETLWYIPLELKTVDKSGKVTLDHKAILKERETTLQISDVSNTVYKLNAETAGVCESKCCSLELSGLSDFVCCRPRRLFT